MVSATNLIEAQAIEAAGIDLIIAQRYRSWRTSRYF